MKQTAKNCHDLVCVLTLNFLIVLNAKRRIKKAGILTINDAISIKKTAGTILGSSNIIQPAIQNRFSNKLEKSHILKAVFIIKLKVL